MKIETKFSIGDKVWFARTIKEEQKFPCPDCKDAGVWKVISPSGNEYELKCPRCRDFGLCVSRPSAWLFVPKTQQLTVGRVNACTHGEHEYMAYETGIGSGTVYKESQLFANKEAAENYAKELSEKANKESSESSGTVTEAFKDALNISQLSLSDATLEVARRERYQSREKWYALWDALEEHADWTAADVRAFIESLDAYTPPETWF